MTMTNKLDLRTCPIEELCEWVAREIMEWRKVDGLNGWTCWRCAKGHLWVSEMFATSLDAVAAVERKAREGRLRGWDFRTAHKRGKSTHYAQWWKDGVEGAFNAPTEPEARLRACALAWEAAKP